MKILFVCSGNTCRSPLAAAIARRMAVARGLDELRITSAGTGALDGSPASDGSLLVGLERGLDLATHRARLLTRALVAEHDLILVMGAGHLEQAEALGGAGKSELLTAYAAGSASGHGIADPYGSDLAQYRETADELEREIARVIDRLASARREPGNR